VFCRRQLRIFTSLAVWCLLPAWLSAAITVATYNLENYLVTDRMVDGVYRPAYPKPQKSRQAICATVAGISPDVLAVQEMGSAAFLEDFRRELKEAGQDFPHAVLLEAGDPERHVAVLAKFPFKEVKRHAAVPVTIAGRKDIVKRGVLEVIFATDGGDLSVFVVHLKSKYTELKEDPEGAAQRLAEARAVRDLVLTRYPDPAGAKFIVCGDWNDTRASKPVQALLKRGDTPLGELVPAADTRGEVWTHFFRREETYTRIDYFLVSVGLKPQVTGGAGRIWDDPAAAAGSDHRAVALTLTLNPVP
jgi:endonuclease/exonuclease/phosphatase family metal-dependent hydrolase